MIDLRPVRAGQDATEKFARRLVESLSVPLYPASLGAAAREAQDYVIGATRAVGTNLVALAVHLSHYRELRYAQDGEQRSRMAQGMGPVPDASAKRYHERELELDAAEQGFFTALGAAMDCLAPVVVGVTGIGLPLRRVDYGNLLPRTPKQEQGELDWSAGFRRQLASKDSDLHGMQVSALRALTGAARAAGPAGWLEWSLAQRNTYVHRERRTEWITFIKEHREQRVARLPPSNPDASNPQALKMGEEGEFRGFYLEEDLLSVFDGLIASIVVTVQGTLDVIDSSFDQRLVRPALTLDAKLDWTAPRATFDFKGYAPGSSKVDASASAVVLNPEDAERLRWAGVLNEPRQ